MKTLVVLSGGADSTTLLYDLIAQGHIVSAISFNYGQRHSRELDYAKATCKKLKIAHKIVDVSFLGQMLSSALIGNEDIPEGSYESEGMRATVVPHRNLILASIAAGYASSLNYEAIALGIHGGDHHIYPDCRPEFIIALSNVLTLSDYNSIKVLTPYLHLTKQKIIAQGLALGVKYEETWTCYKGDSEPCNKCSSCIERNEALRTTTLSSPIA